MLCSADNCDKKGKYEFGMPEDGAKYYCLTHYTEEVHFMEFQLMKMADLFREKRTDVADMLDEILAGKRLTVSPESRFVSAKLPDSDYRVEYDTLTNWLYMFKDGEIATHLEGYEYH